MLNSFRWKLTGSYILIILLILSVMGVVLSWTFKDYYMNHVKSNLIYESLLVAEMTKLHKYDGDPAVFMQEICDIAGRDTENRISIVNQNGIVLGDSQFDARTMELHNNRPEIYQALHGKTGVEIRLSDTAKVTMLYVAVPFAAQDVKGAVRVAKPLNQVEALYRQVIYIIIMAILLIGLAAFGLSIAIAKRVTRPLGDLTEGVQEMAGGDLKRRIAHQSDDEIGILADAVNKMAINLDSNITEISEVKNRLEALLNNTINGILMVNDGGKVNYANPASLSLLLIKGRFMDRKHVEVIGNYELVGIIDQVIKDREPIRCNIILHTLGEKMVEVNVVPLNGKEETSPGGVLVVLNDISEIKRLEQVRKDFVANVSHELKTPVATISGFAETLVAEEELDAAHIKEFSTIIYDEAQRLSRLINRLLELSKLESNPGELKKEIIDIGQLAEYATSIIAKRKAGGGPSISIEKPDAPVNLEGDADLIVQVILNLLDNAINYSPGGEDIKVKIEENEKTVKVTVADRGEGIPEKEVPRIFERFYRVDKARSKKTGGTGLGLAIVKHLVENHGGTVGVETTPGQGSTFHFTLPKSK
ncbi:MAG: ATP-binding protein [Syntrophomonas sp.]